MKYRFIRSILGKIGIGALICLFSSHILTAIAPLEEYSRAMADAEKAADKGKARVFALRGYWAKFPDQPNDKEIAAMSMAWQSLFDLDFHAAMDMLGGTGGPNNATFRSMLARMPTRHQDAYKSYTQWLMEDLKGRGYRAPLPYPSELPRRGEGLQSAPKMNPGKAQKTAQTICQKMIERSPFAIGDLIGYKIADPDCQGELFVWDMQCTQSEHYYTYQDVSGKKHDVFIKDIHSEKWHFDVSGLQTCERGPFQICPTCGGHGKISYEKTVKDGSWHSEGFNSASIDTRRTTKVQATEICPVCHGRRFSKKSP